MRQKFTIEDIKNRATGTDHKISVEEVSWLIECAVREAKYHQAMIDIHTCIRWEDEPNRTRSMLKIIKESYDY